MGEERPNASLLDRIARSKAGIFTSGLLKVRRTDFLGSKGLVREERP